MPGRGCRSIPQGAPPPAPADSIVRCATSCRALPERSEGWPRRLGGGRVDGWTGGIREVLRGPGAGCVCVAGGHRGSAGGTGDRPAGVGEGERVPPPAGAADGSVPLSGNGGFPGLSARFDRSMGGRFVTGRHRLFVEALAATAAPEDFHAEEPDQHFIPQITDGVADVHRVALGAADQFGRFRHRESVVGATARIDAQLPGQVVSSATRNCRRRSVTPG